MRRTCRKLEKRVERLEILSRQLSWIRLGIVLLGAAAAFLFNSMLPAWLSWIGIGLFIIGFVIVVRYHNLINQAIEVFSCWKDVKSAHIARASLDWEMVPLPALDSQPLESVYLRDLNLAGKNSMHHLIDTAGSEGGSRRLMDWFRESIPGPERIQWRNALIRELEPMTLLRDKLRLQMSLQSGKDFQWNGEVLMNWLNRSGASESLGILVPLLAGLNILFVFLVFFAGLPPIFLISFVIYGGIYIIRYRDYSTLFDEISEVQDLLNPLQSILLYLERFPYQNHPALRTFMQPFTAPGESPGSIIRQINRLAGFAAISQRNEILWIVLNTLIPWDFFFAGRLDKMKAKISPKLEVWLEKIYTLEALMSLANFAWLNPDYNYPEFTATEHRENQSLLTVEKLGHPLIPDDERVRNDFRLGNSGDINLVTGSNMSGKSTFLRTLGVNLKMGYTGTVVDAEVFKAGLMQIFTCIQISDSLSESMSYFYAEVRCLKQLYETIKDSHTYPVFYLIDEIFKGTNNRERLIGSRWFIEELAKTDAVGVIATHDLELTNLDERIPSLHNYHFRESIVNQRMVFDYLIHEGPCPTTNALKIMEMEGLPVGKNR